MLFLPLSLEARRLQRKQCTAGRNPGRGGGRGGKLQYKKDAGCLSYLLRIKKSVFGTSSGVQPQKVNSGSLRSTFRVLNRKSYNRR